MKNINNSKKLLNTVLSLGLAVFITAQASIQADTEATKTSTTKTTTVNDKKNSSQPEAKKCCPLKKCCNKNKDTKKSETVKQ